MSQTPTWMDIIDMVLDKIEEHESLTDWHNFDIEKFLREQNCAGRDIRKMKRYYDEFVEQMETEFNNNNFPEDLFHV